MNIKNFGKAVMLSISAIIVGFIAIAVPFRIFDTLSSDGIRILFFVEMTIYIALGMIFLVIQERKNQERVRQAKRHEQRELKIKEVVDNWYNIAA